GTTASQTVQRVAEDVTNPALATSFYHGDHLGSSRLITSFGGWPVWQATYLPYGYEWNAQPTANHYKFTRKERDSETGLDYFGARYYGSTMGRFLQTDPIWVKADRLVDPQRLNLYAYGRNNPLKFTDPTGMDVVLRTCSGSATATQCFKAVTDG